jgi:apolipoprotein D and lipocalin family protein
MARTPQIPDADYQRLLQFVAAQGYELARVRRVPQRWPAASDSKEPS